MTSPVIHQLAPSPVLEEEQDKDREGQDEKDEKLIHV
jgi:hypothetical protein